MEHIHVQNSILETSMYKIDTSITISTFLIYVKMEK